MVLALLTLAGRAAGAEFRDAFADREVLTAPEGRQAGNNTGATVETGEPRHGGKTPRHSVWISWIAPANGLATLRVTGTDIDSLLAVYQVRPDEAPDIRRLVRIVENDDDEQDDDDAGSSVVQFGVQAGERFEIAVDGFAGSTGPFVLEWSLEVLDELIPRITLVTGDRAARVGDRVILEVSLGEGDEPKLHWEFNGEELDDEEELTLVIPSFQEANVGRYRVRVEIANTRFFSEPVELQVSSEGVITALARNKPEDALESPLSGSPLLRGPAPVRRQAAGPGPSGLTRGYNGTQIFNTVFAGRDVNEPAHCGVGGGASYWFAYEPPQSGQLELDTVGSAFDTVLEVYTFDPPLLGYASLRSLGCDNNGGPDGRTSRLRFACEVGRTYLIVVDGVNGARGLTHLNYRLQTNSVVVLPPEPGPAPGPFAVGAGSRVELAVTVAGSGPFRFQWRFEASPLPSGTNAAVVLDSVGLEDAGRYFVSISNEAGTAEVGPIGVSVWRAPELLRDPDGQGALLRFAAAGQATISVEVSEALEGPAWKVAARAAPDGAPVTFRIPPATSSSFFRLRID